MQHMKHLGFGLVAAAGLLLPAATASAALSVDIGVNSTGEVQPGFQTFTRANGSFTNPNATFTGEFFALNAGSESIGVTVGSSASGAVDSRDRGTATGPFAGLIVDAFKRNTNSLSLSFSGLPTFGTPGGTYTLRTFHHDQSDGNNSGALLISGTGLTTPVAAAQTALAANQNNPGQGFFTFNATGPTATFTIAKAPVGAPVEVFLNGFVLDLVSVPAPEIVVLGNTISITDGDGSPDVADGTDFGTTTVGTPITQTFTINNTGNAPLTIGTPTVPLGFTLGSLPSTVVTGGSSTSFSVTLDALASGTFSGDVSFVNNDGDESPFNFTITGTVNEIPEPASLALMGIGSLLLLPRRKRA